METVDAAAAITALITSMPLVGASLMLVRSYRQAALDARQDREDERARADLWRERYEECQRARLGGDQ